MKIKKSHKLKYRTNGGAAMLTLVVFFVFISTTIIIAIVSPTVREFNIVNDSLKSKQAYFTAESGIEDVIYRLKNSKNTNDIKSLTINNSTVTTSLTDIGGGQKQITTIGDDNLRQRKITVKVNTTTGVSFNYGILTGQGGIYLDSGQIIGNVYANGPITASSSGSNEITGTAISADSPAVTADQSNGSGTPGYDVLFANTSSKQDVAQSFKISDGTSPLNKISVYLKKVGSPSNITVRIMNDSGGSVGSTTIASGTISASSVTSSYGWIDASFGSNPLLDPSQTYWLVLDVGSSKSSKYYVIGANSSAYGNGVAKIGKLGSSWYDTNPSGLDYYFSVYLGGVNGLIQGDGQWNPLHIGTVSGGAQAHTVNYVNATGDIYCQSGSYNNKACLSQSDPTYIAMPVSDANISEWKTEASAGGTYSGNYSVGSSGGTIGPKVITGDLSVDGGGTLVLTGNLWVQGNLSLGGGGTIELSPSYGQNDAVIVVDGTVSISGGGNATGSGTQGSYIMILTTNTSTSAFSVSGGAGAMVAYAPYGTIKVTGGASLKEATGYRIQVSGGSSITYESGLTNNNFSSGPSGTWGINSWKETE